MCGRVKWLCSAIKVPPHFQKEKTLLETGLTFLRMALGSDEVCNGKHQPNHILVQAQAFPAALLVPLSPLPPSPLLSPAWQEACERSLAEMESSHQQVMEELQRHHQRELERLRQEKEWLLAEEAAATAAGKT